MRIAIASDHAAVELKADLAEWLIEEGHDVADLGPEPGQSVDYPDYGYRLAEIIAEGTVEFGIALCGSALHCDQRQPPSAGALRSGLRAAVRRPRPRT